MKNGFHFEDQPQISKFLKQLPYELTAAQLRVWNDMQKDMRSQYVMSRLVQGMLDQENNRSSSWITVCRIERLSGSVDGTDRGTCKTAF